MDTLSSYILELTKLVGSYGAPIALSEFAEYLKKRFGLDHHITVSETKVLLDNLGKSLAQQVNGLQNVTLIELKTAIDHVLREQTTVQQGTLTLAIHYFTFVTNFPEQGETGGVPNTVLRSIAFLGIAAAYTKLKDPYAEVAKKLADAFPADIPTAEKLLGKDFHQLIPDLNLIDSSVSNQAVISSIADQIPKDKRVDPTHEEVAKQPTEASIAPATPAVDQRVFPSTQVLSPPQLQQAFLEKPAPPSQTMQTSQPASAELSSQLPSTLSGNAPIDDKKLIQSLANSNTKLEEAKQTPPPPSPATPSQSAQSVPVSGIFVALQPWPCGHLNRSNARFCSTCGKPVSPQPPVNPPPVVPPPSIGTPPKPQPSHSRGKIKVVVLTTVALLVILASALGFFIIRSNQVASANNIDTTATANAQASSTALTLATQEVINATATANTDPYSNGTLAFYDPLINNSQGNQWDEGADNSFGGGCQFADGGYDVSQTKSDRFFQCLAEADIDNFNNFTFEVQMSINQGDCGGMVFRENSTNGELYFFRICQDGTYQLARYNDFTGKNTVILGSGSSVEIAQGLNQINIIAVVANGGSITLYVNHQEIDSVNDNMYSNGRVGLIAVNSSYSTKVEYNNAKIWTL